MRLGCLAGLTVAAAMLLSAKSALAAPYTLPYPYTPATPPVAAFTAVPLNPYVGEQVTLTSYSHDETGPIATQSWDLNGDGRFDDASGPVAFVTFSAPGPHTVSLRVTDVGGLSNVQFQTITVRLRSSPPALMSPFPVVRMVGRVTGRGARITLLSVRGPRRARGTLRCKARRCPYKRRSRHLRRGKLVFKRMQREFLAGTVIKIYVTQRDKIGKYTRFRIRPGTVPARVDRCLRGRSSRPRRCPSG
jgi:hypothetical protein